MRIEGFLKAHKWYYERRRYQYRGQSIPAGRVRSIGDLAQAVMAIRLLAPDTARARPTSLLTQPGGFDRVFKPSESEHLYLKALDTIEAVDSYLRTPGARQIADDATNSRYYLASGYVLWASKIKAMADFANIPREKLLSTPSEATLRKLHLLLNQEVAKLDDGKTAKDRIFKGPKLKTAFFDEILKLNTAP